MLKKAANLSKRWWFLCKSSVKTPPQMNRWLIRSLILHKYDRDEGEILPPNWKVQPAGRRSKFDKKSMGNNRKKAPRNTSPKLKSSKWPSPGLWTSFWQGCSELERKIETLINSTHIQEGYDCLTSAISDNNNILRAVKVSAPLPRGVTAPVSVSEQKIQIIILILKRGPCLIFWDWSIWSWVLVKILKQKFGYHVGRDFKA